MESLLGFLLLVGIGGWYWKRRKTKASAQNRLPSPQIVDSAVRQNYEKKLKAEGVIGGSALESAHGYEEAFKRVMAEINCPSEIKKDLYAALWANDRGNAAQNFLLPGQWEWPEFEKWKKIFNEKGEYPYMWLKYPEIYMNDFDDLSLFAIYDMLNVKDLKAILNKNGIGHQNRSKKNELINLAVKNIALTTFRENEPETYSKLKDDFNKKVNNGKCAILEHTIVMLGYHLRDFYTNKNVKLNTGISCPVEKKYAKGHGKLTEHNLPPFFPGDRTGVTHGSRRR